MTTLERLSVALIIPTLNEANNIVRLIREYQKNLEITHIIVVDSASPDGTAKQVQQHFHKDPHVTLLDASAKRGRGASITYTYRWIQDHQLPITAVAVSDADFSHDPADFPKLVNALRNAEVVVGSRYLKESKIVNWPLSRRLFSRAANALAQALLNVDITDYTNGYRLFTRHALDQLNLDTIDADGFIHLSQELIQWHNKKITITEVPTQFVSRQRGQSNFHFKLIIESLLVIVRLGWENRRYRANK